MLQNGSIRLKPIIRQLTHEQVNSITKKQEYIKILVDNFGLINNPVIADLSRRVTENYSPLNLRLAIGDAQRRLDHPKEAALAYFSAAELAPNDFEIQRQIADLMFELKSLNLAIIQYEKVVKMEPGFILGYHKLAYLYSMKGDYEKAESIAASTPRPCADAKRNLFKPRRSTPSWR